MLWATFVGSQRSHEQWAAIKGRTHPICLQGNCLLKNYVQRNLGLWCLQKIIGLKKNLILSRIFFMKSLAAELHWSANPAISYWQMMIGIWARGEWRNGNYLFTSECCILWEKMRILLVIFKVGLPHQYEGKTLFVVFYQQGIGKNQVMRPK